MTPTLPGVPTTDRQLVASMSVEMATERSVKLLQVYKPDYQAYSGGKDSIVCRELCRMAGLKFESWYDNVTIDPPELVRFIKAQSDVRWNQPSNGNMFHRIATAPKVPPTRLCRWCCSEYKECGGRGRMKVLGVRAAESKRRADSWREVSQDAHHDTVIAPILYWTDEQVWAFIRSRSLPYCSLYDEGWKRLGCVGCPLASREHQDREFQRWPRYEQLWRRAIVANWEKWHAVPNTRTGGPRYQAKFKSGEDFWRWWRYMETPEDESAACQLEFLWTN